MALVNLALAQTIKCMKAAYLTVEFGRALGIELEPEFYVHSDIRSYYDMAVESDSQFAYTIESTDVSRIINESLDFYENALLKNLHTLIGDDENNSKDPEGALYCARNVISGWCLRASICQTRLVGYINDLDSIHSIDSDLRSDCDTNSPSLNNLTGVFKQSLETIEVLTDQLINILRVIYASEDTYTTDSSIMERALSMFCPEKAEQKAVPCSAEQTVDKKPTQEKRTQERVRKQRPTKENEV